MRVLLTSNDPVRLSFLTVLLADAGIAAIVLDAHTSAVEGSIGAIPRRLMVAAEDETRARHSGGGGGDLNRTLGWIGSPGHAHLLCAYSR